MKQHSEIVDTTPCLAMQKPGSAEAYAEALRHLWAGTEVWNVLRPGGHCFQVDVAWMMDFKKINPNHFINPWHIQSWISQYVDTNHWIIIDMIHYWSSIFKNSAT